MFVHSYNAGVPNIVLSVGQLDDVSQMSNILAGDKNILYIISNRLLNDNTPLGIDIMTKDSNIKLESAKANK